MKDDVYLKNNTVTLPNGNYHSQRVLLEKPSNDLLKVPKLFGTTKGNTTVTSTSSIDAFRSTNFTQVMAKRLDQQRNKSS